VALESRTVAVDDREPVLTGPVQTAGRSDDRADPVRARRSGPLGAFLSGDGTEQGTGKARHPTVVPVHFDGAVPNINDDAGARSLPDLLRALFYALALL
jgi:hypothetical protein